MKIEFPLRFADFDATALAHHTTVIHAADAWRLAFIQLHPTITPAPIAELHVTYPRPVLIDRGSIFITLTSWAHDPDDERAVSFTLTMEQLPGKPVAIYNSRQVFPDAATAADVVKALADVADL